MMKRWIERLEGRIREKRPGTGLPDSGCEELIKNCKSLQGLRHGDHEGDRTEEY